MVCQGHTLGAARASLQRDDLFASLLVLSRSLKLAQLPADSHAEGQPRPSFFKCIRLEHKNRMPVPFVEERQRLEKALQCFRISIVGHADLKSGLDPRNLDALQLWYQLSPQAP